jgi:hypothetical protein
MKNEKQVFVFSVLGEIFRLNFEAAKIPPRTLCYHLLKQLKLPLPIMWKEKLKRSIKTVKEIKNNKEIILPKPMNYIFVSTAVL